MNRVNVHLILKKLNIRFVVILILSFFLIALSLNLYIKKNLENEIEEAITLELKQKVNIAYNVIKPILIEFENGKIDKSTATKEIADIISRMTYEDSFSKNYMFMSDYSGTYLVQPYETDKIGINMYNFQNDKGEYVIRELIEAAKKYPEGSMIEYNAKKPGSNVFEKKLAYVIGIPSLNAYIGTGTYIETSYKNIFKLLSFSNYMYYFLMIISFIVFLIYNLKNSLINKELNKEILKKEKVKENLLNEKIQVLNQKYKFEVLFQYSHDGILEFDIKGKIKKTNKAFEKMFLYSKSECKNKFIYEILAKKEPYKSEVIRGIQYTLNGKVSNVETIRFNKRGEKINVLLRTVFLKKSGEIYGGYAIYTDITKTKKYEEKLLKLSIYDTLTGLYNSNYFNEKVDEIANNNYENLGIITTDMNGLKLINDSFGHKYGNIAIKNYAKILKKVFSKNSIVARVGGDEFYIIIFETESDKIIKLVEKFNKEIEKYNQRNSENLITLSAAIGYSLTNSDNIYSAIKTADDMMYRNKLLNRTSRRNQMLMLLLNILKEKDYITRGHTDRVKKMCLEISNRVNLDGDRKDKLLLLAEVHDLGKIAIPDRILNKKGKLNGEEWEIMKTHSEIGYRIAINSQELSDIADLILSHHERWDGAGYPLGISKSEIPVECRILSIVDSYDAMTNQRPYNVVKTHDEAIKEIVENAGKQFDSDIVKIFLEIFSDRM